MTRINLIQSKVAVTPVPKLNTLEYSIYLVLLTSICIGVLALGLYTLYLINSVDFIVLLSKSLDSKVIPIT